MLIHLIFARNFAEGHWFEFSDGQISRANTTFLWEWILAVLGSLTGQVRSNEGFLTLARLLAITCTAFAGWKMFQWGKSLGLPTGTSALVCVFVLLNPVTFYWTAVNPMETSLALVLAVLTAMRIGNLAPPASGWVAPRDRRRPAGFQNSDHPSSLVQTIFTPWKTGLIGGLLIFGLSQTRPEMLAAAPIAALALLLGQGLRHWKLGLIVIAPPLGKCLRRLSRQQRPTAPVFFCSRPLRLFRPLLQLPPIHHLAGPLHAASLGRPRHTGSRCVFQLKIQNYSSAPPTALLSASFLSAPSRASPMPPINAQWSPLL
ncbi:MAG: hypothetical protein WEB60_08030 [Terrimicrobiaceae bacterium]